MLQLKKSELAKALAQGKKYREQVESKQLQTKELASSLDVLRKDLAQAEELSTRDKAQIESQRQEAEKLAAMRDQLNQRLKEMSAKLGLSKTELISASDRSKVLADRLADEQKCCCNQSG